MTYTLQQLYSWAGYSDRKGAIYLLANAHGEPYLDADRVQPEGWESGSEHRIRALAHSLLTGEPVDLSWAVGNHDSTNAIAVTNAIAIASGAAAHMTGFIPQP